MKQFVEVDTQNALVELSKALKSGMFVHVRRILNKMQSSDIAHILESSPYKTRMILWQLVDSDDQGEVLDELSEDIKSNIIKLTDSKLIAQIAENMDTDDLAYILRGLPDSLYYEILSAMAKQDRNRVEKALSYDANTAAGIMNTDTITLRPDVNIDVVLRYLRLKENLPKATDVLYVVDINDKLIGHVALSELLCLNPNLSIKKIMNKNPHFIYQDENINKSAILFERHDWISAPVVDKNRKLLGRLTIDDMVGIIRTEAQHSMMNMAGLDQDEDTFAPVIKSTKKRSVWLGINLLSALLIAFVSSLFVDVLEKSATVAILMTIVPSMGAIAGSQSLTLVIRAIALEQIGKSNTKALLIKEGIIGLLNGILWSFVIAAIVIFWYKSILFGLIIAIAMIFNLITAALVGAYLPLFLQKLKIDPALAGGVILIAITDVSGFIVFLGLMSVFL